jgi:hypothetical protein
MQTNFIFQNSKAEQTAQAGMNVALMRQGTRGKMRLLELER